jgi:hypothetical protein
MLSDFNYAHCTCTCWLLSRGMHTKRPLHCSHFLIYCASPCEFSSFLTHPLELSGKYQKRHIVTKQEETWQRSLLILLAKYLCHTPQGSLTCCKILDMGADTFTSPPKEVVLWIFITLKNPSSLAGFEPAYLGSNGKHDNQ